MCVYLCAEAEKELMSFIAFIKDMISDPERSITKEEKVTYTVHQVQIYYLLIYQFTYIHIAIVVHFTLCYNRLLSAGKNIYSAG